MLNLAQLKVSLKHLKIGRAVNETFYLGASINNVFDDQKYMPP